ncbi:glutathione S-transferase A-like isoform X1 [Dreissena polymorpha]|uniref:Glutathione S-transferase n=1 Tax=Dreissena polymorpha TaxID=45954 RepID=A0A9D4H691_DREPO|nr:glutathione S-transferase A-like isoform X1 [Dreissena polymorpha]XP_052287048.1 glutathione S-transferase A-like isoform X1 [Dreissena polymorpha]KAH3828193.1 hypothetical protein DPMN_130145 [Dreissena polymorpha]
MAANKDMFLWWGSGSPPCWKPMLVLAEKEMWEGLPNKLISFDKKENKEADILAANPRGQVPTFKDGSLVVNESNAICMYLEEKYSNDSNRLLPVDVEKRSQVYWRMFESGNIQSNITVPIVYLIWNTKPEDRNQAELDEKFTKAKEELGYWERTLTGRSYLVGDRFTMADVFFYPFVAFLVRLGATLREFPALKQYYDLISQRPTVQATWPPHWKEGSTAPILAAL